MQHLFYCSEPWFYAIIKPFHIPVNVFLSCLTCFISSYYKVRHNRPYPAIRKISQVTSVLVMYLWIVLPLFPRFATCYFQRKTLTCDNVLHMHIKEIIWFGAAGLFYGSNIPHRWLPGVCDFIGHGHQIFHVCIMMTTFYANEAVFLDMLHKREQLMDRMPQSLLSSLLPIIVVIVIEFIMIYVLTGTASKKLSMQHKIGTKKLPNGDLKR